jgi:hypothetical protein
MSPTADDGGLIIIFPRAWTAAQRLAFMADVARALPRERWPHVGERMCTDRIEATAPERRAVFAQLAARRARGVDQQDVSVLEWTGLAPSEAGSTHCHRGPAVALEPRWPTVDAHRSDQMALPLLSEPASLDTSSSWTAPHLELPVLPPSARTWSSSALSKQRSKVADQRSPSWSSQSEGWSGFFGSPGPTTDSTDTTCSPLVHPSRAWIFAAD